MVTQHADVLRTDQRVDVAHLAAVVEALQDKGLRQRLFLLEDYELVLWGGGMEAGQVGQVVLLPLLVGYLLAVGSVARHVLFGVLFLEVALAHEDGLAVLEGRLDCG